MVSMAEESHRITGPLREWHGGNQDAANQLMELVYGELHRIASRELRREGREHTLQTTALVHEAYLRPCGSGPVDWQDRATGTTTTVTAGGVVQGASFAAGVPS